ncbi:hypothetical protein CPU12_12900 [Malaciobacter molluscorum LMG 25693]|uniref:DUF2914 domain-containing protein n=1 Tax=Malaciobacter molluscorum LMG 25693 TaxID=870501 RepID=A0A2G1DES8_9BACT|nr:hypothetical protein [Malaciobacter molluscorum]AXX93093.1 hypothetical protein AMOL_2140 [Malaciobacter molluscorum LMG 25693]PHO16940.1 hypothetical protein CPU12_12900 [Malaciobacter molluscorum LMG 25693]RXJ95563.1 hypothetical protein CRV00_03720 [Malaciobacter molluscorum]
MKKFVFLIFLLFTSIFAQDKIEDKVDCVILEDENSIICKYNQDRVDFEKKVIFEWIDPDKEISRSREMIIPAQHGSIYDFRYIDGRKKGTWLFRVKDGKKVYETKFEIK